MRISRRSATCIVCWTIVLAFFGIAIIPLSALAGEGETIKGVVKNQRIRRFQALVYIDRVEGKQFPPPQNVSYMSQKCMAFDPHILPVLKGTTVDFSNDDKMKHNVFSVRGSVKMFNLGEYGQGVQKRVTFDKFGEVNLLCYLHPEMEAYVIVLQNPYFALTDKKGNFEIKDVPPGVYQLNMWHEKLKDVSQEVVVEKGKVVSVEFKELKKR